MEIKRGERGFTLIEVMIAMAVSMAILTAGTALYVNGIKQSVASQSQSMANSQAQKLATMIENDIKQGAVILASSNGFTTGPLELVLQVPAWDSVNVKTLATNDIIAYKYYEFITDGLGTHKVYNIQRRLIPGAGSSRTASDVWVFPYSETLDAGNLTNYRSDPYAMYWLDSSNYNAKTVFKYYVQDGSTGKVKAKVDADPWASVLVVEARMTVYKKYNQTTIPSEIATRTRLRNWVKPP